MPPNTLGIPASCAARLKLLKGEARATARDDQYHHDRVPSKGSFEDEMPHLLSLHCLSRSNHGPAG
jgi:hypothetical protein